MLHETKSLIGLILLILLLITLSFLLLNMARKRKQIQKSKEEENLEIIKRQQIKINKQDKRLEMQEQINQALQKTIWRLEEDNKIMLEEIRIHQNQELITAGLQDLREAQINILKKQVKEQEDKIADQERIIYKLQLPEDIHLQFTSDEEYDEEYRPPTPTYMMPMPSAPPMPMDS